MWLILWCLKTFFSIETLARALSQKSGIMRIEIITEQNVSDMASHANGVVDLIVKEMERQKNDSPTIH